MFSGLLREVPREEGPRGVAGGQRGGRLRQLRRAPARALQQHPGRAAHHLRQPLNTTTLGKPHLRRPI